MPPIGSDRLDVSVVVPSHDRAHTIVRALRSVQEQTVLPREIVLVDDGSRDATVTVARGLRGPVPLRIFRQRNQGAAAARNLGMARAAGSWIAFLDSDDEWLPGKLADAALRIRRDPALEFLHTDRSNLTLDGREVQARDISRDRGRDRLFLLSHLAIKTSTVLVSRALLGRMGPWFATDLATCEDYEFFWRAVAVARSLDYTPEPLTRIHWGTDGLSRVIDEPERRLDNIDAMSRAMNALSDDGLHALRRRLGRQRRREIGRLLRQACAQAPAQLPGRLRAVARIAGSRALLEAAPTTVRAGLDALAGGRAANGTSAS